MALFYTLGHSTRTLDELIEALRAHSIQTLADIRSLYFWMKELGGRRKKIRDDSPNVALRSPSFRNYADYMLTEEFERGIARLIKLGEESRTAYMCAERVYFRCHRMLVSDWLTAHGHEIFHLDGTGPVALHKVTPQARSRDRQLIYGGDRWP